MMRQNRELRVGTCACCLLVMCFFGMMASCAKEAEDRGVYNSAYGLYVIDDEPSAYVSDDASAGFNSTEQRINGKMNDYAVRMLVDYGKGKNTLLSPVTSTILYSMMANFTGETKSNSFQNVLGINEFEMKDVNSYCHKLVARSNDNSASSLNIQNDLWIKENESVYNSFLNTSKQYKVQVKGIQFGSSDGNTAMNNSINKNMKKQNTTGIGRESWSDVKMVVTSSMNLERKWKDRMYVYKGDNARFQNFDGSYSACEMLRSTRNARYASFSSFDVLEIPYEGDDYSMYIVYPHERNRLEQSLQELSALGFDNCIELMHDELVDILFPKFEFQHVMDLNPQSGSVKADIKNVYQTKLPKVSPDNFSLSDIYQACHIDINEKGISVTVESGALEPEIGNGYYESSSNQKIGTGGSTVKVEPVIFHVEHPFAVFIRSKVLGIIPYACCMNYL